MKEAELAVEKLNVSGKEMEKMKDAIVEYVTKSFSHCRGKLRLYKRKGICIN
ncbi:hypothetical protein KHA80_10875 [Anaerobacillus sp. HL2]|nr:hypothetical protein KHA80_10875 [Anaerobacillus sp. HL2]